ncbi:HK97 gp10 family phage protein [Phascolarctobacterium succinatutens]|uniref:HK97 gp10 family phage protein n=1 Tax=Phascolarctobacterium succinatutens TaxID=626940 RepID=UPI0026E9D4F1|nr:HK97 gp10 family phage protein [Phascolarctobacterium succinatutens]
MPRSYITTLSDEELTKCLKQIKAFDGKTRLGVEKALRNGTKRVRTGAARRVAVRSGTLKRSLRSGFSRAKLEGVIRAKQPYAHLVEYGAQGFFAKPKKTGIRALKMNIGGKAVYSKSARVPARKARPFLAPAFEDEAPRIIADVKKEIENA